jgi:hypothetical protein
MAVALGQEAVGVHLLFIYGSSKKAVSRGVILYIAFSSTNNQRLYSKIQAIPVKISIHQ